VNTPSSSDPAVRADSAWGDETEDEGAGEEEENDDAGSEGAVRFCTEE